MRRSVNIKTDLKQINTVEDLAQVFESIASMHISKIRDRVVASHAFFNELWQIYRGLRIDPKERLKRSHATKNRNVMIIVTSEGKLSGHIDEDIVETMLAARGDSAKTDLLVIGSRGVSILQSKNVAITAALPLPVSDTNFNVAPLLDMLSNYDQITVFYQTYESLRSQKVARIDLISAVRSLGEGVGEEGETLTSHDYIFEPSVNEIADYMESVMMGVALIQIIMESKLAQYAARFNTMSTAKKRADELLGKLKTRYHRAKRSENDERLKEIMKAVKNYAHSWSN